PGRNFLQKVMFAGGSDSPYARAMRGHITLSQLFSEMEEGCRQHASASGITLPPAFSVARAFGEMAAKGTVNAPLLQAARVLRRNGFKTCVLANNWVDDSAGRLFTATLMNLLRRHFDLVIESCRLGVQKPDPHIYTYTLDALQAKPQEVIILDDVGENLKPARDMGMATVLVRDTETVLKELEELSGVQARRGGLGPLCALLFWSSADQEGWARASGSCHDAVPPVAGVQKVQSAPGAAMGVARDDVKEYSQEQICKDLVVFLDKLGIPQTVLVGHDWGGAVVWNMALFYPERVRAVASLNTPYRPADPSVDIVEKMKTYPSFDYQFYFQEPVLLAPWGLGSPFSKPGGKPDPSPALCHPPRPAALNRILVEWLEGLPPATPLPKFSRL
ncbi:bifunctional epoxide hydrolase 2, partial [Athene cunicularia]|uniref:bifunctional epoxide hydrolase 2 n=1 Tax=Athene cunicularia TaxID=194338 RepID=UPI000EF7252F